MERRHVGLLLLVLVAGACARPPAAPAVDLAAEEQAVRDASAAWMAAAQARDWAAAAASFAADGVGFPDHKEPLVGPAANQANMEADWAETPNATISWTTTKVVVAASGDLAYETGTFTFTNEGDEDRGNYLTVWRKIDGAWKAVADMGVSSMPEADSAAMKMTM